MTNLFIIDFTEVSPTIVDFLPIRWYGLFFAISFFLGFKIVAKMYKKDGFSDEALDKLLYYVMAGTIVGARLGHVFFYGPYWDEFDASGRLISEGYFSHPFSIVKIWEGGLASHGAAIGILIAVYFYAKKITKKSMLYTLDQVVIVVALAAVFIRLGNLINQEIVGSITDVPWAFYFKDYYDIDPLKGEKIFQPRHPAQLYEAITYFFSFLILYYLYLKTSFKNKQGFIFGLFLVLIFTARLIIENYKEVQESWENNYLLHQGQMLSIPFIVVGVFFMIRAIIKNR